MRIIGDVQQDVDTRVSSIGAATGSNPTVAATWTGAMAAGRDSGLMGSSPAFKDHLVEGDVTITLPDIANPSVNVTFTNVTYSGDRPAPINLSVLEGYGWTDLAIENGGFGTAHKELARQVEDEDLAFGHVAAGHRERSREAHNLLVGSQIVGKFYGPNAEEVGGLFFIAREDEDDLRGAFGAKR